MSASSEIRKKRQWFNKRVPGFVFLIWDQRFGTLDMEPARSSREWSVKRTSRKCLLNHPTGNTSHLGQKHRLSTFVWMARGLFRDFRYRRKWDKIDTWKKMFTQPSRLCRTKSTQSDKTHWFVSQANMFHFTYPTQLGEKRLFHVRTLKRNHN